MENLIIIRVVKQIHIVSWRCIMNTYYDSYENYKKFLDDQVERAAHNFQEAKEKAIRELQAMTVWTASEYGAGYASQIENAIDEAKEIRAYFSQAE